MNCREANQLLDTAFSESLSVRQGDALGAHLASCRACSEEWVNWRDVAALQIPPTPPALRERIRAALPTPAAAPASRLRPYLVGSALLAVAAAAAMTVQLGRSGTSLVAERAVSTRPQLQTQPTAAEVAPARMLAALDPVPSLPSADSSLGVAPAGMAAGSMLDPRTVLVLNRPEAAADASAVMLANQCHDAVVAELSAPGDLRLITGLPAGPEAQYPYPLPQADRDLARARGAGHVLTISTENGCRATLFDTQTGTPGGGAMHGQALLPADGWRSFAASVGQSIRNRVMDDPAIARSRLKATLLNTSLTDTERANALTQLQLLRSSFDRATSPSALDQEMVMAAIQLGTNSSIPGVRGSVWAYVRGSTDPRLVQPLLRALANDPDAVVRMQAAYTLKDHIDSPGVREGLLRAAAEDADDTPPARCCLHSVREAAERAAVSNAQFRGWVRGKLLDESLPARARLLALDNGSSDGRFVASLADIGSDAARTVFEIGRREQDPAVRSLAWRALQRAPADPDFLPVLLGDLDAHGDEHVRAAAAEVLMLQRSNPQVMAALEQARNDTSMQVRRVVTRTQPRFQP